MLVEAMSPKDVHRPGHVIRSVDRVVALATVAMETCVINPVMVCMVNNFEGLSTPRKCQLPIRATNA